MLKTKNTRRRVYVPTMWVVEGQSKCIAQQTQNRPEIESLGFLFHVFFVSPRKIIQSRRPKNLIWKSKSDPPKKTPICPQTKTPRHRAFP